VATSSANIRSTERFTTLTLFSSMLIAFWIFLGYETLAVGLALLTLSLIMRFYTVAATNAVQKARVLASYEGSFSDEPLRVTFTIVNVSRVPIAFLEFLLHHSPYLRASTQTSGTTYLPPRGSVKISFVFDGRVGKHLVGPLKVVVRDPLGLYRSVELPVGNPIEVRVMPKPSEALLRRALITSKVAALSRTRRVGVGVEFYGVREYMPGDELRRISWKHYSLWGKPFVKLTEEESSLNLVFLVYLDREAFSGIYKHTPFEHVASVVASIARYSARRNDLMCLHASAGGTHIHTRLMRGRRAYQEIMNSLAEIPFNPEVQNSTQFKTLSEVLGEVYRHLPRDRSIILLLTTSSSLIKEAQQLQKLINFLSSRGHVTYVVCPLTQAYEVKGLPEWGKALYRLKTFETIRNEVMNIRKVRELGIPVMAMGPENVVQEVVSRLEALRS